MSTDDNISLVRRYIEEAWNTHNPGVLDDILAADAINHAAPHLSGPEGFKQIFGVLFAAFPDAYWTIEDIFAAGDRVATRGRWGGTHLGDFFGIPATGRLFEVTHMHIFRIEDGKIAEHWANRDDLGHREQLGMVLMPA